ncbi:MAG: hypothetical protein VYE68_15800 [Acidobacteriota bacterium]|nr:hypothetical protein [Acidobacteriota bacterium]
MLLRYGSMVFVAGVLWGLGLPLTMPGHASAAQPGLEDVECGVDSEPKGTQPDPDLYCIELVHAPDFPQASGHATLTTPASPFGTSVTVEGHHRLTVTVNLAGLPDPGTLGAFSTYVAWVTTPQLRPIVNLGPVSNGRLSLGDVEFDKFLVLVTAEAAPDGPAWEGRIVLRGVSAGMRMEPEDLLALTGLITTTPGPSPRDWIRPPMPKFLGRGIFCSPCSIP